jgi:hypothetical protein
MANWEIEKIRERQKNAIGNFGFLTIRQLNRFLKLAESDPSLIDGYYERSTGWSNHIQFKKVSEKLANYIKSKI